MSKSTSDTNKKSVKKQRQPKKVLKDPRIVQSDAKLRKKPVYKSFRLHGRVTHHEKPIINSYRIAKKALSLMWANRLHMLLFSLVYGILFLLLVRGLFNPINIGDLRAEVEATIGDGGNSLSTNRVIFGQLLGSLAAGLSGEQGIYQIMLIVIGALAMIWLYRQQQAGNKVNVKQAFYRGMYPLIPFTLIIYVIILQMLPGVIGNFLYSTVTSGGIASGSVEQFIWLLLYISSLLLSFYLISSSIIALMIVTLPEMTPMIALRKAKELVTFRRFSVFRKTVMLGVFVAILYIGLVIPALFISSILAQMMFLVLSILIVPFAVGYIFVLYRELL